MKFLSDILDFNVIDSVAFIYITDALFEILQKKPSQSPLKNNRSLDYNTLVSNAVNTGQLVLYV